MKWFYTKTHYLDNKWFALYWDTWNKNVWEGYEFKGDGWIRNDTVIRGFTPYISFKLNNDIYGWWYWSALFIWAFFYADFISPKATQEDIVTIMDKSENATQYTWYINDKKVSSKTFPSRFHEPFNLIHKFNVSGIYKVGLQIYTPFVNDTETKLIYIDWNLTLNTTNGKAGINYASIPFKTTTYKLAEKILKPGEWIHFYDSINETWLSVFKFNDTTLVGDNITLDRWSSIAIVVGEDRKVRINISDFITTPEPTNFTQRKTIHKGYWYLGWSGDKGIDSYNLSKIGLEEGDWVFAYDTINGTWYGYRINFAGDKFIIKPHEVIIALVGGDRDITIPS